jgi:hypothetical protein
MQLSEAMRWREVAWRRLRIDISIKHMIHLKSFVIYAIDISWYCIGTQNEWGNNPRW